MIKDTICAIATGLTSSGISIIRVSGPSALSIVDSLFVNSKNEHVLSSIESHTMRYGFLLDGEKIIDEVLVSYFKGPRSFTAEDTVEINCHGGIFVTNQILELVVKNGARLASPGEFTKRAFLNGRIDLTKAEAVMDVISSENALSLRSSISQLRGSVYKLIKGIRSDIIYEIAFIESALDDPEHISLDGYREKLRKTVDLNINKVNELIKSADTGRLIKDGIKTVIVGKPNAGKSSILNMISGTDRAIVTDIAGTTRDIIEEKIRLGDVNLLLYDTAGIRDSDDIVEQIGVKKALEYSKDADLIIYVVDSSTVLDDNDIHIQSILKDRKSLVLYNKSDLESKVSIEDIEKLLPGIAVIKTSAILEEGLDELSLVIKDMFVKKEIQNSNEVVITSLRQKESLMNAKASLEQVLVSLDNDMPEDFYSIDLMSAYSYLGNIIGEEISDDLVNEIFSKFCMGK